MVLTGPMVEFFENSRMPETVIFFQTFGRRNISSQSLESLMEATRSEEVVIIVTDATPVVEFDRALIDIGPQEYVWSPGDVSLATSRNLGVTLCVDKYVPKWLLFVEDDVLYSDTWYRTLLDTGKSLEGRQSPLGLSYGVFSASPEAHKPSEAVYDDSFDVFASQFGLRADQRLYSASHYFSISRFWDSDLFGISSSQTGKINHRSTMRGFCGASIGHKDLCTFVEGQESTHLDLRDIGPAAFDKRPDGYKNLVSIARSHHTELEKNGDGHSPQGSESKAAVGETTVDDSPAPLFSMSSLIPGQRKNPVSVLKRLVSRWRN